MWSNKVQMMERDLRNSRANWMFSLGRMTTWNRPDIQVGERNVETDVSLALEGYYLMHEWKVYQDFITRWKDEKEREKLWKEVVEFWGFEEAFPKPPFGPSTFQREQGWIGLY
jgi:hypothetical protein